MTIKVVVGRVRPITPVVMAQEAGTRGVLTIQNLPGGIETRSLALAVPADTLFEHIHTIQDPRMSISNGEIVLKRC